MKESEPPAAVLIVPAVHTPAAPPPSASLAENPAAVYLAGLAPGSRRTMRQAIEVIAEMLGCPDALRCPWHRLRFPHTTAVRALLMQRYAAATANKMLSALRGVLKAARRLGLLSAEDYARATDLDAVRGARPEAAAGRALSSGELLALMQVCMNDRSLRGARDAALLAVAYGCGLRRAEIVALRVADLDRTGERILVRGKRNKTRVLPLPEGALAALDDWLGVRGAAPGPLFVRLLKGDRKTHDRLTTQAVYYIERRRGLEAGVSEFTPHDLRRSFAGDLLDAGVDVVTVQKLMGHASANTTASYDRRGERAKRKAARALHVPYAKRG